MFASTAGARSSIFPILCTLIENVVAILKGVNHFSIQPIVFPAGVKMLILATDALSKFNTGRLPWQPAGNHKHGYRESFIACLLNQHGSGARPMHGCSQ